MKRTLLLAFVLLPLSLAAQVSFHDEDSFGGWLELGMEKDLGTYWEWNVAGELRTEKNFTRMDRWSLGTGLSYKPFKYLKMGVNYDFLCGYTTDKMSKEEYTIDGELMAYRYTPSYWTPRHRLSLDVSSSYKFRWVRFSIRERYQYTHQAEKTITGRYDTEMPTWEQDPVKDKVNPAEDDHLLRSRIKMQVDKKKLDWSPFLSVEAHNRLTDKMRLHKVRTAIGTEYKVNSHNNLSFSLVMTNYMQVYKTKMAVNVGYSYDF